MVQGTKVKYLVPFFSAQEPWNLEFGPPSISHTTCNKSTSNYGPSLKILCIDTRHFLGFFRSHNLSCHDRLESYVYAPTKFRLITKISALPSKEQKTFLATTSDKQKWNLVFLYTMEMLEVLV